MTINERFKEIRLNLNKTQADFGEVIVQADHVVAFPEEPFAQMRADKIGRASCRERV